MRPSGPSITNALSITGADSRRYRLNSAVTPDIHVTIVPGSHALLYASTGPAVNIPDQPTHIILRIDPVLQEPDGVPLSDDYSPPMPTSTPMPHLIPFDSFNNHMGSETVDHLQPYRENHSISPFNEEEMRLNERQRERKIRVNAALESLIEVFDTSESLRSDVTASETVLFLSEIMENTRLLVTVNLQPLMHVSTVSPCLLHINLIKALFAPHKSLLNFFPVLV